MVGFCTFLLILLPATVNAAEYDNALVIIADDLGVDKVGSYAGDVTNPTETRPKTPNIDTLAGAGVRFTDAWATPVCSPTRATLYSGEYPFRTGIGGALNGPSSGALGLTPITLEQLASDAGISTALFGKWHAGITSSTPLSPKSAFDHEEYPNKTGFEVFEGTTGGDPTSYTDWIDVISEPDSTMSSGWSTSATRVTSSVTDRTNDDALDWLAEEAAAGNRTLAVVSYNLPHDTPVKGSSTRNWADAVASCGGTTSGDKTTDQRYAVECMDSALGELLEGVPDLEHTLVVFLGDNGTPGSVGEGYFKDSRGKATVYESGIRVPFIIADGAALQDAIEAGGTLPEGGTYGIDAGAVVTDPAGVVDVYATIVDLMGLSTTDCTLGVDCARDSISLRSVLMGGDSARSILWSETYAKSDGILMGEGALRKGDVKLIVRTEEKDDDDDDDDEESACREYALYDLSNDRWEKTSVLDASDYAATQAELMATLEAYAEAMKGTDSDWLNVDDCCGKVERWYDGRDSDCDGADDYDQDRDGHDAAAYGGDDCDDLDVDISPDVGETWYDGVDEDCDGADDFDQDGDGFDAVEYGGDDCDDLDDAVSPGLSEVWYDGVDEDCDGADDYDQDGDGHEDVGAGGDDCDDLDSATHPDASDAWYDGVDSDCDGVDDFDRDGDGYEAAPYGGDDCDDEDSSVYPDAPDEPYDGLDADCGGDSDYDFDGDGFDAELAGGTDCDDHASEVYPGAPDLPYDGMDSDCAGGSDYDADRDGYDAAAYGGDDCDDDDTTVHPGATDLPYDAVDSDCDGADDFDADHDGYDASDYGGDDCDDDASAINPGIPDIFYDGVDSNCDGADDFDADQDGYDAADHGGDDCDDHANDIHPGAADTLYDGVDSNCDEADDFDADGDGYDAADYGGDDCNDEDSGIHPDAPDELYDGVDSDCAGGSDYDADNDGYDAEEWGGDDCDDTVPTSHPGAMEIWYDGLDENCDGLSDYDADSDGYVSDAFGGLDCDDGDPTIHPGAPERSDGVDSNCDGAISGGDLSARFNAPPTEPTTTDCNDGGRPTADGSTSSSSSDGCGGEDEVAEQGAVDGASSGASLGPEGELDSADGPEAAPGCACSSAAPRPGLAGMIALLALASLSRRRDGARSPKG